MSPVEVLLFSRQGRDERIPTRLQADDRVTVTTTTAESAVVDRLADPHSRVDCVVSDHDPPDLDGLAVLERVREEYPDLPFVLSPTAGDGAVASEAVALDVSEYVPASDGSGRLVDRIHDSVEQYDDRRRDRQHERLGRVLLEAERALRDAASVETIEKRICSVLSDASPYVSAAVAGVEEDPLRIDPRVWGGELDEHFERLDMRIAEGDSGRHTPGGRAYHERTIAVTQDIQADPEYERWRDRATSEGARSIAVVPLEHDCEFYGLLGVFADRPHAFDETERTLLSELASNVGQLMHARETQTELRMTASRLEALFDRSPDMINVHDAAGNLLDPNARLCEKTGYTQSELTEMSVWELDSDIDPDEGRAMWAEMTVDDERTLQTRYRRKNGSTFPVEVRVCRLDTNERDLFVAIGRDITDRVEREAELRRNERRFQSLLKDPNLLLGLLEPDGTVIEVNETGMSYVDADLDEVVGQHVWKTPWWPEEMRSTVREKTMRAATGEYVEYEADLTYPNGQPYSVSGHIRPVTDHTGAVCSLVISARDVTAGRERKRELRRQSQQFDDFAAAITHELRNTVSIIDGYLPHVAGRTVDDPSPSVTEAVDRSREALDRMERVVDDLSTLARYGTPVENTEPCELKTAARTAHQATDADVDLRVESDAVVAAEWKRLVELFCSAVQFADLRDATTVAVTTEANGFAIVIDAAPVGEEMADGAFTYGEAVPSARTGMCLPTMRTLGRMLGLTVDLDHEHDDGVRIRVGNAETAERHIQFRR